MRAVASEIWKKGKSACSAGTVHQAPLHITASQNWCVQVLLRLLNRTKQKKGEAISSLHCPGSMLQSKHTSHHCLITDQARQGHR